MNIFKKMWNVWFYGQEIKPHKNLVRGSVCKRSSTTIEYPLPCGLCNMLAQDEGLSLFEAEKIGFLFIKDGELIQQYHLPGCPRVTPVINAKGALQSAGIIR